MKQFLLLVAVIAVILGALLVSLYVLDLVKLAELQNDLRKVFGVLLVAALAGILIMFLVKVAQSRINSANVQLKSSPAGQTR